MEFKTAAETAAAWGVSTRWVNMCARAGRVPGTIKAGTMWLLPAGAQKPRDGRRLQHRHTGNTPILCSSANKLYSVVALVYQSVPSIAPETFLSTIGDERIRLVYRGAIAYASGNFQETLRCYLALGEDPETRLCAASIALAAAISLGDDSFYLREELFLQGVIRSAEERSVSVFAELALSTASLGAMAPGLVPRWLRDGDFSELFPQAWPDAAYKRAKYYQCLGQYEAMLAVAETALSFCDTGNDLSITGTYLRLMCAAACFALNKTEAAENHLIRAMRANLPFGYITPFVELIPFCGGAVEQMLERDYPDFSKAAIFQWQRTFSNWIVFHNRFTKDNITVLLSHREFEIALLVSRGEHRRQIAARLHISTGRLNNILTEIFGKLSISGRDELRDLIL